MMLSAGQHIAGQKVSKYMVVFLEPLSERWFSSTSSAKNCIIVSKTQYTVQFI